MFCMFLITFVSTVQAPIEPMTLHARHTSFSNDPIIENGRLEQTEREFQLILTARFANDCLADAGVTAETIDFPVTASQSQPALRVLSLRQRVHPQGCPDILMPVSRTLRVTSSALKGIRSVVLLNVSKEFSNLSEGLRARRFEVGSEINGVKVADGLTISATEKNRSDYFPVLGNVEAKYVADGRRGPRYTLQFEVIAPQSCHDAGTPDFELRESSGGPDDESGDIRDWLTVFIPGAGSCSGANEKHMTRRYTVTTEEVTKGRRQVVIVNRVLGQSSEKPFSMISMNPPSTVVP